MTETHPEKRLRASAGSKRLSWSCRASATVSPRCATAALSSTPHPSPRRTGSRPRPGTRTLPATAASMSSWPSLTAALPASRVSSARLLSPDEGYVAGGAAVSRGDCALGVDLIADRRMGRNGIWMTRLPCWLTDPCQFPRTALFLMMRVDGTPFDGHWGLEPVDSCETPT